MSLYSKLTRKETQGIRRAFILFYSHCTGTHAKTLRNSQIAIYYSIICTLFLVGFSQGIRRFSGGLGNLLAPLWAGGLVNNLSVSIGVLLAMIILATVSKNHHQ